MSRFAVLLIGGGVIAAGVTWLVLAPRPTRPAAVAATTPVAATRASPPPTTRPAGVQPIQLLESASRDEWLAALRQRLARGATAEEILSDLKFLLQQRPALALDLALALARDDNEKYRWVATLVSEWTGSDPAAAWAWTLQPAHAHVVSGDPELPALVLARVAQFDPDRVVALAESVFQNRSDENASTFGAAEAAYAAVRALVGSEHGDLAQRALERWANSGAAEAIGNAAFEEVALDRARRSRTEAAEWLRALPPSSGRDFALATIAADWSTSAPAEAIAWAASLDTASVRTDAMQRVFNRWAENDMVTAAQWVADHEAHPEADKLIANLVGDTSLSRNAPDRALQWAALIRDPALRFGAVQHVVAEWSETDPNAASRFVATDTSLTAAQREQLLEILRQRATRPPQ